jgi:hypothetical protein
MTLRRNLISRLKSQSLNGKNYNWLVLNNELKHFPNRIIAKWGDIISDKSNKEEDYQSFINNYAGFFFNGDYFLFHVISKLRLGADFITDFVLVHDEHSNGFNYEFIEIESPHSQPYLKSGKPSSRLTTAIQQIEDWRLWLKDNRTQASKILPASGMRFYRNANYRFTIIIGQRDIENRYLEKRRELSNRLNIQIRSFDYLSTLLMSHFYSDSKVLFSHEFKQLPYGIGNGFANPFYKGYSDKNWREIVSKMDSSSHYTAWNAQLFLDNREFNTSFKDFEQAYESLSKSE